MSRIICFGNRSACKYKNNPAPPANLPMDKLELWATLVCNLNIDAVPKIGEPIKDSKGNTDRMVTADDRRAFLTELIETPVLAAVLTGHKLCTKIRVSPASTLLQAVNECLNIVRGDNRGSLPHMKDKPVWIAGTDSALVQILAQELGISEIREYEEHE